MRVGGSAKRKPFGPYSIISLITIWSFLVSVFTQASPEYFSESISPPSRFSCPARITETEKGFCVVQDGDNAAKECKNETTFVYINLLIGKALRNNQSIAELKEHLKIYRVWQLRAERIAKTEGLYVTYRRSPRDPPRTLHYFLHEKKSYTDKYISLSQETDNPLLIEHINEKLYQKIKNDIKVLFSPEDGCEEEVINAIDSADKTIDALVCSFTNIKILEALKRARRRGVVIRLFLNGKRASNRLGMELESKGIKVKYYSKRSSLMQNKFMIVDEESVYTGSYDWTLFTEKDSRENLIMLPYVVGFSYEFDYLWSDKERPPPRAHSPPSVKVLFLPKGRCENELIELIQKVKNNKKSHPEIPRSIKIALYHFTNKDIAKALFDAKENGVDIEIILDISQKKPSYVTEKYFNILQKKSAGKGGHLYIKYYRIPKGMRCNKFAVIGDVTVTGSYSWAKTDKNREDLFVLPSAVKDYCEEFDRLMKNTSEEIRIDEGKYTSNQPRGPPPEASLQSDESLHCPTQIIKLVNDTVKLLSNTDPYKSSGKDPPTESNKSQADRLRKVAEDFKCGKISIEDARYLRDIRKGYEVNNELRAVTKNPTGFKDPYKDDSDVVGRITTNVELGYVRFYVKETKKKDGKIGKWIVKKSEIFGLTPEQIKNKLSLPCIPTYVCDVRIPLGTPLRAGVASAIDGWGNGGGEQVELLDFIPKNSYRNVRRLEIIFR